MRIREAFEATGIDRTDMEVLLAHIVGRDRAWILSHDDEELDPSQEKRWLETQEAYGAGQPVSYITGMREFYGRNFRVDHRVHIPRPSTENLLSLALSFLRSPFDDIRELETGIAGIALRLRDCGDRPTVVDVGTGSGCIAITLALERPDLRVIAIDKSADALAVAKLNAERLEARVEFVHGDLLAPLSNACEPFVVISNPPYLPSTIVDEHPSLRAEPRRALDGGKEGSDVLSKLWKQAHEHSRCTGIIMECMKRQADPLLIPSR